MRTTAIGTTKSVSQCSPNFGEASMAKMYAPKPKNAT